MRLDKRVERVEKLFLGSAFAAEKLDIIDQQQVKGVVVTLEIVKSLMLVGANDIRNILLRMNVADFAFRGPRVKMIADGLDQVRFAKPDTAVYEQRVVSCSWALSDLRCRGTGKIVGFAGNEGIEGERRV